MMRKKVTSSEREEAALLAFSNDAYKSGIQ